MNVINRHVGFLDEAPESVIWSNSSFVKAVHPKDHRNHGFCDFVLALLFLGTFIAAGLIFAASKDLSNTFQSYSQLFFIIIGIVVIIAGLLIGMFRNYLMKQVLIHKISSRSELLFQPDQSCFYVGIENPSTYNKLKKYADDFGLLNITDSHIQIEMLNHRAQVQLSDLTISRMSVGQEFGCIILTSIFSMNPWSIAVIAQSLPGKIISLSSAKGNSQKLYKRLLTAGVQPAVTEPDVNLLRPFDVIDTAE